MQYWINHKGVQSGPVELDDLKKMGLTSAAFVWHEGLTDWVRITQLPELQGTYQMEGMKPELSQESQGEPVESWEDPVVGQPYQSNQPQPTRQQIDQPQYAGQQPASEPCPPTNLVWAIISTLLCCLPVGVVAIVYATKVTNLYRAGDIEGAKRASETGAWWCIASIVLGIVVQPFISYLPLMLGN